MPGPVALVQATLDEDTDMPRIDELLVSVRDFLHREVMASTEGRTQFFARVAGNSLELVRRERALGAAQRQAERARLEALLDARGSLTELRWQLCHALREERLPLTAPGLTEHLRQTVVNQVAIDQPGYSGLKTALNRAETA